MTDIWPGCNRNHISHSIRSKGYFSSPKHPYQLQGLTSLLFVKYWAFPTWGNCSRGMKLTSHAYLVPRIRISGVMPPLPQCLHGVLTENFTCHLLLSVQLTELWFSSVYIKIHKLSKDRCTYYWHKILSQRVYGLVLSGLGYS